MKTTQLKVFMLIAALTGFLFSCDGPIGLGDTINLEGPDVEIITPLPRQPVDGVFSMSGTTQSKGQTTIDRVLIKVKSNREEVIGSGEFSDIEYPLQWRYQAGSWKVSADSGTSWETVKAITLGDGTAITPKWNGNDKSAEWELPIDMTLYGLEPDDGQYQFSISAWDSVGNSDDNSYKTRTVIVSRLPPVVTMIIPTLYQYGDLWDNATELYRLDAVNDDDDEARKVRRDTENIGKFLTGAVTLQWQIDSKADVWSIDIRFYDKTTDWDNDEENYIYRTFINDAQNRPAVPSLSDTLKPFYRIEVPDMSKSKYFRTNQDGRIEELKEQVELKKTLRVVVRCMDAAGNQLEEKDKGLFMYWPKADYPWLVFPDGLKNEYPGNLYTLFPDSEVPIQAFDNTGVDYVKYDIYTMEGGSKSSEPILSRMIKDDKNYTTFSWVFTPPSISTDYFIEAAVYDVNSGADKKSDTFTGYFSVKDPNAPEIDEPYNPVGAKPLFEFIRGTTIDTWEFDIIGKASDNMNVDSVSMVWINPASVNYAAMSQLAYFRDASYEGWALAPSNPNSPPGLDTLFDSAAPNKIWNMNLDPPITEETADGKLRKVFTYRKTIRLKEHLNIAPGEFNNSANKLYDYLKTQVFVFKATDDSGQSTIISWSAQGDAKAPVIGITSVAIDRWDNSLSGYNPAAEVLPLTGYHPPITQLKNKDRIRIEGTWDEDSAAATIQNFMTNFFERNVRITINSVEVPKTITRNAGTAAGTWSSTVVVGADLSEGNLKDTLVLSANVTDMGGNPSEDGASWLVESDKLRFLRVSSVTTDGYYNSGKQIIIFLEFNKPVSLSGASPVMRLNTAGTPAGTAAHYYPYGAAANTRQYFLYTAAQGQNADKLTVTGIQSGGFTWTDNLDTVTLVTGTPGVNEAKLPITTNPSDRQEYPLTLMGGRSITIDTIPPTQDGAITSNPGSGYHKAGTILYFTMKFNETLNISAGTKLKLNIRNGSTTEAATDDAWVSDRTLTFSYTIKPGDYSGDSANTFGALKVTGITGTVSDQAGNNFTSAVSAVFSGLYVDTIKPNAPDLKIVTQTGNVFETLGTSKGNMAPWNPASYASSAAFNSNFPSADITKLESVYSENLHMEITAAGQSTGKAMRNIEYSINYGKDWEGRYAHTAGVSRTALDVLGQYDITARAADMAGNYSDWTKPVTLNWDKGALLTRITTTASNGIKTNTSAQVQNNPRVDTIPIVLTFRNKVKITSAKFYFNIVDTNNLAVFKNIPSFTGVNTAELSHTFTYTVGTTDFTVLPNAAGTAPASTTLQKDELKLLKIEVTATDERGTNVSSMISLDSLTADDTILHRHKDIYIQTGALQLMSGFPQITGSRNTDNEYDAKITLRFNSKISRGPAEKKITITQNPAGYRIPAVLTENQRSRYRSALGAAVFDKFYTRGTSGYIQGTGADTTSKYILNFEYDTYNIVPNQAAAAGTIEKFAWDFLQSEKIELTVYSTQVELGNYPGTTDTFDTLTINLSGLNALKVLGAQYTIEFEGGLVQDAEVGLPWGGLNYSYTVPEVAQPAIRIKKPQEVLAVQTGSINTPLLAISNMAEMGKAQIRLDCRTPNSQVRYTTTNNSQGDSSVSWSANYDGNPPVLNTPAADPVQPAVPTSGGTLFGSTTTAAVTPITIGNDADGTGMYNGYKYRIRAAGVSGGTYSAAPYAEEIAFRSVIVFVGNNITTANGQNFTDGDQLWIRGGNTNTSTTIPGFPLTPEDNWNNLEINKERAGIRLMNKVGGANTNLNSSTWQFVTWDMNVPLYFDLYLGHDDTSAINGASADVKENFSKLAFQYGPKQYAIHVGNWTPLRNYYMAFQGERRWLNSGSPDFSGSGARQKAFAFFSTFTERPADLTVSIP